MKQIDEKRAKKTVKGISINTLVVLAIVYTQVEPFSVFFLWIGLFREKKATGYTKMKNF